MKNKKIIKKIVAAASLLLIGVNAQAVPISHTIDFDDTNGSDNGVFEDGPFTINPYAFQNTGTNCPSNTDPLVVKPCTQLNTGASFVVFLTDGGVFDLVDFWWISTGGQENSDLTLEWPTDNSQTFGFTPGNSTTDHEFGLGITGVTSVTFRNASASVLRIDNISLRYDDGTEPPCDDCEPPPPCDDCEPPISVPEPGTLGLLGLGLLGLGLRRRSKV